MYDYSFGTSPRDPPRAAGAAPTHRRMRLRERSRKRALGLIKLAVNAQVIALVITALVVSGGIPFGVRPFCITSSSMEPNVPAGSLVFVNTTVDTASLSPGDAITFVTNQGQTVVTHRIQEIDPSSGRYVTKGDANKDCDPAEVSSDQVIGVVIGHLPYLGTALSLDAASAAKVLGIIALVNLILAALSRLLGTPQKKGYRHDSHQRHRI